MGAFSRSWEITKLSFAMVGKDKEMLFFPLFATISSILYLIAMALPSGLLELINPESGGAAIGAVQYLVLFLIYFGLAFIATFFNVCVVYTVKTRFEGGDATLMDSLKFALTKLSVIFQWSLISATVGVLLAMLDRLAERMGGIGGILLKIVRGMLGMMWSILTLFVVPTLVYEDISPVDAIKRSTEVIKKTWGESLIRHYGLGLIQFVCLFVVIGSTIGLMTIVPSGTMITIVFCAGALAVLITCLVFNVANTVFNTALYVFATTGEEPREFAGGPLESAFLLKDAATES